MEKLVIFGASGLGREVLWVAREINKNKKVFDILGFIDDDVEKKGKIYDDIPVLGGFEWIEAHFSSDLCGVCAIGNTVARKKIHQKTKKFGIRATNLIHPSVKMTKYVDIGEGVIITAGNILTTQITLHDYVFLNLGCTVGHEAILKSYTNCAPNCNVSGNVILEKGVHLGTGVQVINNITIGEWTTVGAGAVVIKNLPSHSVAVGIPAKIIKENRI